MNDSDADPPRNYVPRRGDIVWITLSPQAGHEQAGRRPALVLSPEQYNGKVGLAVVCPITNQSKGYPFQVPLPTLKTTGVVMADQMKSIDWRARRAVYAEAAPPDFVAEVAELATALLTDDSE